VPKLRTLSGHQARAILESHGFALTSQKGSHWKMRLEDADGNTVATAIVPDHATLKTGTLQSIIRQSGLGRGPFEN
jgi:predicted RNA binding protein YcfA (HicA-like mRNA interferase family)